jgi:CheY-like chemotaxis protein
MLRGCGRSRQNWRLLHSANDEQACIASQRCVQIDVSTSQQLGNQQSMRASKRLKGEYMPARSIRVLVVEDYEPFQRFVVSILEKQPELQIICRVSDGLEAVQKAEELQPDLILLDIGLPSLNGIEVARRIRKLSPKSKILFVSQESSADVVQGALGTGAQGYVVKSDARRELLEGVNAILRGEQFVGSRFSGNDFVEDSD